MRVDPRLVLVLCLPFLASCKTDGEISENDLAAVDKVAMDFVQNALGPNPEAAYSIFTADAKGNVSSEKFMAAFRQGIQPNGPFKNLRVVHTYLPQVTGGTQEQRVVCGNLSSSEGWVAVNAKPGQTQAHVIVEAQTLNNTWAFVTWLLREQKIGTFSILKRRSSRWSGRMQKVYSVWPSPRCERITISMHISCMRQRLS